MVFVPRVLLRRALHIFNRKMATQASDQSNSVLFLERKNFGLITLNKPKALNSIDRCMVKQITEKLEEWEDEMEIVVIQGVGRAFCAGGDVVAITKDYPKNVCDGRDFFRREYTMNHLIGTYKIPYIAILDGITMGGGVGLSVHGQVRIATENTLFAMPETAIGLFPDVGASHFLSRLPGGLGPYLGLTGKRLNGLECLKAGIATHYMESKDLPAFFAALYDSKIKASSLTKDLEKYTKDAAGCLPLFPQTIAAIDKIFKCPSMEEIMKALDEEGSGWALETKGILQKMSPTALKITVKELDEGKNKTLKECLQMEFNLAWAALEGKVSRDFYEGVRAMLIDKDKKPKWNPPSLDQVKDEDVKKIFDHLEKEDALDLP